MTPMAVRTREGSTPDNANEVARSSGPRHDALGLSLDDVKRMYRLMLMTRLVSERILQLNRMGRTPFGAGTDVHEAANFASIHKLPVVFVIENNLLAISTRFEKQMAVANVADRAAAYAMPGHIADGMDVLDSYEKTRLAADHARAGKGPALVELKCYRYQPHTSDDDDSRYRTRQEGEEWKARDPVKRGREYLLGAGASEPDLEAI